MLRGIRKNIDKSLKDFARTLGNRYELDRTAPNLAAYVRDFITRKAKRVRPVLFALSYLGHSGKNSQGLYSAAVSLELLHDFVLIHDDIIDDADLRRGLPSMHALLGRKLKGHARAKFGGEGLAIIMGDVLYAMGIGAFMSADIGDPESKQEALRRFADTAVATGTGEWQELLCTLKDIGKVTKEEIFKIYDLKTAQYTFSLPLSLGAMLAGSGPKNVERLAEYGRYLGRAFQIRDDILDMFQGEDSIGKSPLTDLREAKRTTLLWEAFNRSSVRDKAFIRKVLTAKRIAQKELLAVRSIVLATGALERATDDIRRFREKAKKMSRTFSLDRKYRGLLDSYTDELLDLAFTGGLPSAV